jgi:hypothetical protein
MTYDVDINVQSAGVGSQYNVGANQITQCPNWTDQSLVSVTNKTAAVGGTDKETNVDYAKRIKEYYISRHLGTPYGFKQFIMETLPEVQDLYVAGYNDKYMTRDTIFDPGNVVGFVINAVTDSNVVTLSSVDKFVINDKVYFFKPSPYERIDTVYNVNSVYPETNQIVLDSNVTLDTSYIATKGRKIGGKVDIHVKGCKFDTHTVNVLLNSNCLLLQTDYSKIVDGTMVGQNLTDATKTVSLSISQDTNTGKGLVKLSNFDANHMSYDPNSVSTISIYYKYLDSNNNPIDKVEMFTVGLTEQELLHPFEAVIDIKDAVSKKSYFDSKYYTIQQAGIVGTSQENAFITFIATETDDIPNGTAMEVTYSVNETVNQLEEIFNFDDNRVVVSDMLFKQAGQVYVNVGFSVRLKDNQALDDFKINTIKNSVAEFFSQAPMGQQIEESNIVAWLYQDSDISQFLDFIALPFTSFYVASDLSEAIQIRRDGTYLDAKAIQYPVLNKISVTLV